MNDVRLVAISVQEGTGIVTQEGNSEDDVLRAGGAFTVQQDGKTILAARTDMTIRLSSSPQAMRKARVEVKKYAGPHAIVVRTVKFPRPAPACWTSFHGALVVVAAFCGILLSGCAAPQWPTVEEQVGVWLTEQPRVVKVEVDPSLPEPNVLVRDHKAGERIGKGAVGGLAGAGLAVMAGCFGGPFGCIVGVLAAPVGAVAGAVYGAVRVDSVDVVHAIVEAQGAPELYQLAVSSEHLQSILLRALLSESEKVRGDGPRLAADADSGGTLTLSLSAIDLFGDVGEDPSVSLRLRAYATVKTPEVTKLGYAEAVYQGSRRPISEWKANNAKLFREELAAAAQEIAEKTVQRLGSKPPSEAFRRVAHAREREAAAVAPAAPSAPLEAAAPEPAPAAPEPPALPAPEPAAAPTPIAVLAPPCIRNRSRNFMWQALPGYAPSRTASLLGASTATRCEPRLWKETWLSSRSKAPAACAARSA